MGAAFEIVADKGKRGVEVACADRAVITHGKPAILSRALLTGLVTSLAIGFVAGGSARRVDDFATAALFPPHRAWAIDELARQTASGPPREDKLQVLLAYGNVQPDCRRTGSVLYGHGRFQQAGQMLAGCNDLASKKLAVTAFLRAGSLQNACRTLREIEDAKNDPTHAQVMLLGGCREEAAHLFRLQADGRSDQPREASTLRCIALGIDAVAGNDTARQKLGKEQGEACRLVLAALREGPERLKALRYLAHAPPSEASAYRRHMLQQLLAVQAGGQPREVSLPPMPSVLQLLSNPSSAWTSRAHGLERDALEVLAARKSPSPDARALRMILALRAATFELFAGRTKDAMRLLDVAHADWQARGNVQTGRIDDERWVEHLRAEAQIVGLRVVGKLFAGDTSGAASTLTPYRDLDATHFLDDQPPRQSLPAALSRIEREVVRPLDDAAALLAAARGKRADDRPVGWDSSFALLAPTPGEPCLDALGQDGPDGLLQAMQRCPSAGLPTIALAGRRLENVPGLVDWLRYRATTAKHQPLTMMWEASLAARGARLIGDDDLGERRKACADAYRDALLQRDVSWVFALLPSS